MRLNEQMRKAIQEIASPVDQQAHALWDIAEQLRRIADVLEDPERNRRRLKDQEIREINEGLAILARKHGRPETTRPDPSRVERNG